MEDTASPFGGSEPEPVEFRADHPFIFFIEHKETGQILFMGKAEDPSS
jgi:serpin B